MCLHFLWQIGYRRCLHMLYFVLLVLPVLSDERYSYRKNLVPFDYGCLYDTMNAIVREVEDTVSVFIEQCTLLGETIPAPICLGGLVFSCVLLGSIVLRISRTVLTNANTICDGNTASPILKSSEATRDDHADSKFQSSEVDNVNAISSTAAALLGGSIDANVANRETVGNG